MGVFFRHFQHGNDVAAQLQIRLVHFLQRRVGRVPQQFIGQQHGKRLAPHDMAGAPHGMAQPGRFLLAHIDHAARFDLGCLQHGEFRRLALGLQAVDQFAGDTLGVAIGVSAQNTPTQIERYALASRGEVLSEGRATSALSSGAL